MPTELEAKLKVDDHGNVRAALQRIGAKRLGAVFETNHILDRTDSPLKDRGAALRVRSNRVLDGEPREGRLTYKGPAPASRFKARQELEVSVDDPDGAVALLHAAGFVTALLYEKHRETWRAGECLVELDELPVLGRYVEVEGPDEGAITQTIAGLGLQSCPVVQLSYVALLVEYCDQLQPGVRVIRFPA